MTATYDDDPTDDLHLDMLDGDEVKIAKVERGVNDYVAVNLNGGVKDKVNPIWSWT